MSFSMPRSATNPSAPSDGERHGEQHRNRQQPAPVQRGENQEHHDDGKDEREDRRAAGAFFLERLACPGDVVAIGQRRLCDFLHRADRIAGAHARLAAADDLRSDKAVEAFELLGPDDLGDLHQRFERNHLAAGLRAHVDIAEIVGIVAERRFGLHLHAERAAVDIEVVDVQRAHRALQRIEHSLTGTPSASAFSRSTSTRSCGTFGRKNELMAVRRDRAASFVLKSCSTPRAALAMAPVRTARRPRSRRRCRDRGWRVD